MRVCSEFAVRRRNGTRFRTATAVAGEYASPKDSEPKQTARNTRTHTRRKHRRGRPVDCRNLASCRLVRVGLVVGQWPGRVDEAVLLLRSSNRVRCCCYSPDGRNRTRGKAPVLVCGVRWFDQYIGSTSTNHRNNFGGAARLLPHSSLFPNF